MATRKLWLAWLRCAAAVKRHNLSTLCQRSQGFASSRIQNPREVENVNVRTSTTFDFHFRFRVFTRGSAAMWEKKFVVNFACTLPSSISGTRSRAMRRWKAHDEKNSPIVFVFSFSLFAGLFCEKTILACCLA